MSYLLPMVVLIPTHNRNSLLERTLSYLAECTVPNDRDVRIVIVENGGCYGAEEVVRNAITTIPIKYQYFDQGNKSAALNSVIKNISDSIILFLDDDIRVDPLLLCHYSKFIGSSYQGKFFGGGLLVDHEEPPPDWLLKYLPHSIRGWHPKKYSPLATMFFFGANWAAFSKDIKNMGGFDHQLGPGGKIGGIGQETAMQQKLFRSGAEPVYIYDAVVWHYVPKSCSSPEWALNRAYRMAITQGYNQIRHSSDRTILDIPLWLIKSTMLMSLKTLFLRLNGSLQTRFHIQYKLMENLGYIKGLRSRTQKTD